MEQALLDLLIIESLRQGPTQARSLSAQQVIVYGARRQAATACYLPDRELVLMFESEDFLDLTHGYRFSGHGLCRLVLRRHTPGSLSRATPLLNGRFGPFRTQFGPGKTCPN